MVDSFFKPTHAIGYRKDDVIHILGPGLVTGEQHVIPISSLGFFLGGAFSPPLSAGEGKRAVTEGPLPSPARLQRATPSVPKPLIPFLSLSSSLLVPF